MPPFSDTLEIRHLRAEWKESLLSFLDAIHSANETQFFAPHEASVQALDKIIEGTTQDLYYLLCKGRNVIGYGLLRGWDEGYEIPSLGIAIHPEARNCGLARMFMHFLHTVARWKGARKVRLRVHRSNSPAKKLYDDMGYQFLSEEGNYLIGFLDLGSQSREAGTAGEICTTA